MEKFIVRRLAVWYILVGLTVSVGTAWAVADDEGGRPNVLLLLTDQQTMRAMSAYGNPYLHTPNMDTLASPASASRFPTARPPSAARPEAASSQAACPTRHA